MKYQSKSAYSYIMRNFGNLFYVALPVAVLMAFFANPTIEIDFLHKLLFGGVTMENVFPLFSGAYTVLRFRRFWWVNVIAFVLLAFTVAMLIVKISRHMRMGLMPALPFKRTFSLFPTVFLVMLCYFGISEILGLLPVGVTYVLRATNNAVLISVAGVCVDFVVRLLSVWVFMLLVLAFPLKYSENYHFNVGLSYSVRVMTKLPRPVWTITLVYVFGRYLVMLCAYFARAVYLDVLIYALCYLFAIVYLPAFAYKVYHDAVGGERRDLNRTVFD